MRRVLYLLPLLAMIACVGEKSNEKGEVIKNYTTFPEVVTPEIEEIEFGEKLLIANPGQIMATEDRLWILDPRGDKNGVLKEVSLSERKVINKYGAVGKAKTEFEINAWRFFVNEDVVSIYGTFGKLVDYKIGAGSDAKRRDVTFYKPHHQYRFISFINDSTFVTTLPEKPFITFINLKGEVVDSIMFSKKSNIQLESNDMQTNYLGYSDSKSDYSKEHEILATALLSGNLISIQNLKSGEGVFVIGEDGVPRKEVTYDSDGNADYAKILNRTQLTDIQIVDDKIYVLCMQRNENGDIFTYLNVFDFKGNPIKSYKLNSAKEDVATFFSIYNNRAYLICPLKENPINYFNL